MRRATVPSCRTTGAMRCANASFMTSVQSSASSSSAIAVDPRTSQNSIVTTRRSPDCVPAGGGRGSERSPQALQNLAPSGLSAPQAAQRVMVRTITVRGWPARTPPCHAAPAVARSPEPLVSSSGAPGGPRGTHPAARTSRWLRTPSRTRAPRLASPSRGRPRYSSPWSCRHAPRTCRSPDRRGCRRTRTSRRCVPAGRSRGTHRRT